MTVHDDQQPEQDASEQLPSLLFFIGLAGSGKSFAADVIAAKLGYYCYDFDADVTPAMRRAIAEKRPFSEEVRDEYMDVICRRLAELRAQNHKLVVSQAVYKKRHRDLIKSSEPDVVFVWVTAPHDIILDRLARRGNPVTPEYATSIERNFEAPMSEKILVNDTVDADGLFARFLQLFAVST